jgi:nucleoside-diphosphate-sugar epimerase
VASLKDYSRIIVTGANGWLGRRVMLALAQGLPGIEPAGKIRALVAPHERTDFLRALGVECIAGDMRDAEARHALLNDSEGALLIHLAGVIHPALRVRDLEAINHIATLALHRDAAQAKITRAVVMSSNSPFGANASPDGVFDEDSPYNPYMGYGRSKMHMEQGLDTAMVRGEKPETVILRAPWFYGPGQPPRQTLFFTMIRQGKFPLMGSGQNRRSMGYVDSLAQGILLAATVPQAANRIYWLADERPYPMREIIDTVKTVLREDFGMKVAERDLILPPVVADIARFADRSLQALGLYQQKIHVLSEMNLTIACSIARAKAELGYRPLVELREGMRRSIEWCLKEGQKI